MRRVALLTVSAPLGLIVLVVAVLGGGVDCLPGQSSSLSKDAKEEIPSHYARLYSEQARRWNIDVAFLASIGAQETDHGRHPATNEINPSGCGGPMQLGTGGACGDFWGRNKCDGDGDGKRELFNAADNICAAAKGLRQEKNAPPAGGSESGYYQAACRYYGACATYAREVMARAELYGFRGGQGTDTDRFADHTGSGDQSSCATPISDSGGNVVFDPGANQPGRPLQPEIRSYLEQMAALLPRPLVVTTGTNHSKYTTTGNISDHWSGDAADFGSVRNGFPASGGGYGDRIAETAFRVAGEPPARARALARRGTAGLPGGTYQATRGPLRIQIIWKSHTGGDHFNHTHLGVKRVT